MKKTYLFIFLFLILTTSAILANYNTNDSPEEVIKSLYKSIDLAEQNGDYECCIEPACTMCYLGKWKFEKGTCHCDQAIKENKNDDVCPECKSGIEKGLCKSSLDDCLLDEKVYGGAQ